MGTTNLGRGPAYMFRYVVNMAQNNDARITILHVTEPIPPMLKHVGQAKNGRSRLKSTRNLLIERIKSRTEEF